MWGQGWGNSFAFSGDTFYRADIASQRFSAIKLPIKETVTGYIGKLANGVALVTCDNDVYAFTLP